MAARPALVAALVAAAALLGVGWYEFAPTGSGADRNLLEVARAGDLDAVRAALAAGARPLYARAPSRFEAQTAEAPDAENGYTALHYAAISNKPEVAKALLEAGAKIDARSSLGNTPLMLATGQVDLPMATLLIAKGADKGVKNDEGKTASDFAQKRSMTGAARKLAEMLAAPGGGVVSGRRGTKR